MSKVIVIGGGASGMISAIFAKRSGNDVTIIEKNEKLGKKIYITGKGRCNILNNCDINNYLENVVTNKKFMYSSINSFSPQKAIDFFESIGLKLKTERGNRVFPTSEKASDVTKFLQKELERLGVKINLNECVKDLIVENNTINGVKTDKNTYNCDKVIICTGGISYSSTGSTGDGIRLAKIYGHKTTKLFPSLVGFNLQGDYYKDFQGVSLKNVTFTAKSGQKELYSEFGEMLFTHFGISGPIVLTCSAYINKLDLHNIDFYIDFKPALSQETLENRLIREFSNNNLKTISNVMRSLLPQCLIKEVLVRASVKQNKVVSEISKEEREKIIFVIKNFKLKPASIRSIEEAIITSGGIDVKDINPKTMESKVVSGLFFAGETIDVDCLTGGYNLQTAFSTGYVAGNNV